MSTEETIQQAQRTASELQQAIISRKQLREQLLADVMVCDVEGTMLDLAQLDAEIAALFAIQKAHKGQRREYARRAVH